MRNAYFCAPLVLCYPPLLLPASLWPTSCDPLQMRDAWTVAGRLYLTTLNLYSN